MLHIPAERHRRELKSRKLHSLDLNADVRRIKRREKFPNRQTSLFSPSALIGSISDKPIRLLEEEDGGNQSLNEVTLMSRVVLTPVRIPSVSRSLLTDLFFRRIERDSEITSRHQSESRM